MLKQILAKPVHHEPVPDEAKQRLCRRWRLVERGVVALFGEEHQGPTAVLAGAVVLFLSERHGRLVEGR